MLGFLKALFGEDLTELMPRIRSGEITLVDVRSPAEVAASGKAEGAQNLPLDQLRFYGEQGLRKKGKALSPETPIALYCASGARSAQGKRLLLSLGYKEVYNIGGFHRWSRAGGAVTR